MTLLSINWTTVWLMTGLGIGTVFCILLLLVLVLQIFSAFAPKAANKVVTGAEHVKNVLDKEGLAEAEAQAAVSTAVYLYLQSRHDDESGILTIHHEAYTPWHSELNKHL